MQIGINYCLARRQKGLINRRINQSYNRNINSKLTVGRAAVAASDCPIVSWTQMCKHIGWPPVVCLWGVKGCMTDAAHYPVRTNTHTQWRSLYYSLYICLQTNKHFKTWRRLKWCLALSEELNVLLLLMLQWGQVYVLKFVCIIFLFYATLQFYSMKSLILYYSPRYVNVCVPLNLKKFSSTWS